jgi:hypothetical protein
VGEVAEREEVGRVMHRRQMLDRDAVVVFEAVDEVREGREVGVMGVSVGSGCHVDNHNTGLDGLRARE